MRNSQLDISSRMERHPTLHTPAWPKFSPLSATASFRKELWPPRSPDLRPPDYFLWGYLKGRVYQNKTQTIAALKANITEEIQAVTADVLARTFQNKARRVQSCLDANGGQFQHMLWCRHISHTTYVLLFKFRCNIFIGVRIIKEMPGSVASGIPVPTAIELPLGGSIVPTSQARVATYIQNVQLKSGPILIWVIYLLRFTCYITQLTRIYSKCWKWCPFISMHLSTRFNMFLATFLNVLSFTSSMARVIFMFKILNFSKKLCLQWA